LNNITKSDLQKELLSEYIQLKQKRTVLEKNIFKEHNLDK
jgi:hypothetical protein